MLTETQTCCTVRLALLHTGLVHGLEKLEYFLFLFIALLSP